MGRSTRCIFSCCCDSDLEKSVEELRNDVLNRKCRVNVTEIENMALALSTIAKSLGELKGKGIITIKAQSMGELKGKEDIN